MAESITRVGNGVYRIDCNGRTEVVYVAGPPDNRWAFWNGRVFRAGQDATSNGPRREARASHARQSIEAPMPATVLKVLVESGASVRKGDPLVVLEAMKMELPIRAEADASVTAVRCKEGERVEAGAVLVELK